MTILGLMGFQANWTQNSRNRRCWKIS